MVNIYILEALIVPHAKLSFTDPCSEVQKSKIINVFAADLAGNFTPLGNWLVVYWRSEIVLGRAGFFPITNLKVR